MLDHLQNFENIVLDDDCAIFTARPGGDAAALRPGADAGTSPLANNIPDPRRSGPTQRRHRLRRRRHDILIANTAERPAVRLEPAGRQRDRPAVPRRGRRHRDRRPELERRPVRPRPRALARRRPRDHGRPGAQRRAVRRARAGAAGRQPVAATAALGQPLARRRAPGRAPVHRDTAGRGRQPRPAGAGAHAFALARAEQPALAAVVARLLRPGLLLAGARRPARRSRPADARRRRLRARPRPLRLVGHLEPRRPRAHRADGRRRLHDDAAPRARPRPRRSAHDHRP